MGPRMLELAGARTDGTILWLSGPRTIETQIRPALDAAATRRRPARAAHRRERPGVRHRRSRLGEGSDRRRARRLQRPAVVPRGDGPGGRRRARPTCRSSATRPPCAPDSSASRRRARPTSPRSRSRPTPTRRRAPARSSRTCSLTHRRGSAVDAAPQVARPRRGRRDRRGRASRASTASRCARSTLPPYLNLARTSSTRIRSARITRSRDACSDGSTTSSSGLQRGELRPQHRRDARRRSSIDRDVAGELHRRVVGGRDPEARVLVADRLPARRHERPVAGHREHDGRVLGDRVPDRVACEQVDEHVVAVEHVLRRHDHRDPPLGPPPATSSPNGCAARNARHSLSSPASTPWMNTVPSCPHADRQPGGIRRRDLAVSR